MKLLISANVLYGQYKKQAEVISHQVGGVYVERNFVDSKAASKPYTPVPKAIQKAAMNALAKYVLQRISDTGLYGNDYSLTSFMKDLTSSIFVDGKSVNSMSQNLQIEYVQRLIKIASIGKNQLMII